jgi:L-lactate dehydrogenase complex protein LldG
MYDQFKVRAEAVGAEVHRFDTPDAALEFLVPFLKEQGIADAEGSYAVCADPGCFGAAGRSILEELPGMSFEVTRDTASRAKFGISRMGWGVADTGSLVQDQGAVQQRLASSLPEIHIALLGSADLVASKLELFRKINPQSSRYIAFITGPSRTADIERVLTIGVHGPQRLIILCIDQPEGEIR